MKIHGEISTKEAVLAELIGYSRGGVIYDAGYVLMRICVKCLISKEHMTIVIKDLEKIDVVKRQGDALYLCLELKEKCDGILITENERKGGKFKR